MSSIECFVMMLILDTGDIGRKQDQFGRNASQRLLQTTLDQGSRVSLSHCQGKQYILEDLKRGMTDYLLL